MKKPDFKCNECGVCCSKENGIIIVYPEDAKRIAKYFLCSTGYFLDTYCQKKQLYVSEDIKTTVYQLNTTKGCVFLTDEKKCSIHVVKPLQCRLGPVSYFQSIGTWKNCIQYKNCEENPFKGFEICDEYFVLQLLKGYEE